MRLAERTTTSAGLVRTRKPRSTDAIFLSQGALMAQHAPDAHADERLLREIAQREQELQRTVAEARAEADRIIERARREAEELRARAREQAREQAAAAVTRQILSRAQAEADALRKRGDERRPRAVDLVVREVLGSSA